MSTHYNIVFQNSKILFDKFSSLFNDYNSLYSYEEFTLLNWQTKDGENLSGNYYIINNKIIYKSSIDDPEEYLLLNKVLEIYTNDSNKKVKLFCNLIIRNGDIFIDDVSVNINKKTSLKKLEDHKEELKVKNKSFLSKIKEYRIT